MFSSLIAMLAITPSTPVVWRVSQEDLSRDISNMLADASLSRGFSGVFVKEAEGQVLFELNPDKRFIPASTAKLVAAATALDKLGPNYKPVTYAWSKGGVAYLLGGADPGLTVEEMKLLRERFSPKSVLFDDSLLGEDRFAPGWQYDDLVTEDASPVSGLTVNKGKTDLWSSGGKLYFSPQSFGLAAARGKDTSGDLRLSRAIGSWKVEVSGEVSESEEKKLGGVSLPDPALCAARILSPNAKRATNLKAPFDAVKLQPRSIADLLKYCLVESDNHYAETLLRLAGRRAGKSGSWESSLELAGSLLSKMGISPDSFRLHDGSGLSRFNELTPRSLVQLLDWELRRNRDLFPSLMCGPGQGTLKKRLSGLRVWAKTGTMTGVSCIAGYLDPESLPPPVGGGDTIPIGAPPPKRIIFAIMFNHYAGKAERPREIQDLILSRLSRP